MRANAGVADAVARTGADLPRGAGLSGRVVVTFAMAGGVLVGGFLVAAMTLAGKLSGNALLLTSTALYVVGVLAGAAHGVALGWFGRPMVQTRREAAASLGLGALYAIIGCAVAWLVSGWIAMTAVALYLDRIPAMAGVAAGWAVGAVVVGAAIWYGWQALRNAYERWADRVLGTALVAASFGALLVTFLAHRPVLWGTAFTLNEVGAVLLAAVLALWVAGPAISIGLAALRRFPLGRPVLGFEHGTRALTNLALGTGVGVILGVLALPFYTEPYLVPTAESQAGVVGSLIMGAGQALVSEVLLRLFVVTAVAMLLLRWYRVPARSAALIAIAIGAVVQVALYLPAVVTVGFPTALAGVGFVLAAAVVPGIVLGVLYWKRGFATALMADAVAMAAILVLAA